MHRNANSAPVYSRREVGFEQVIVSDTEHGTAHDVVRGLYAVCLRMEAQAGGDGEQ